MWVCVGACVYVCGEEESLRESRGPQKRRCRGGRTMGDQSLEVVVVGSPGRCRPVRV